MLASILAFLPGCASAPSPGPTASADPAVSAAATEPAVAVVAVSETPAIGTVGNEEPSPVTDAEIANAQESLRDATAWGARHYQPQMYAAAQGSFDAALRARAADPLKCRSLLADVMSAAASAKAAALQAYQADVKNRFETARSRLVEVGADRAYPEEFAGLVSGIQKVEGLFAAGSYWDARMEAYHTLRGMEELHDRVLGLQGWIKDAVARVQNGLETARGLGAPTWAPELMQQAEQGLADAQAQVKAGDLDAAANSLKAAGVIATRLPLLKDQMDRRSGVAGAAPIAAPIAAGPASGERLAPVPAAGVGLAAAPAENLPPGQRILIGHMSMSPLGAPQKLFPAFSAAVSGFDLVAAEGLRDAGIMEKVLAGLDDTWEAAVSRSGYFGFIFGDRIQMVKDLGTYPDKGEFLHAPYGAQFRLAGTRFRVNLVLCNVEGAQDRAGSAAAAARLAEVQRYFENLTGNHGITLLLAGGGARGVPRSASGAATPQAGPTGVFASEALRPLVEESGWGGSTPRVAYVTLGAR